MESTSESLLLQLATPSGSSGAKSAAWNRFVSLYTPLLFGWARKMGLSREDAADLIQDVFAIVVRRIAVWTPDPQKSFRGWLRTVALNRYRELLRRHTFRIATAGDSMLGQLADPHDAEISWERDYASQLVRAAMDKASEGFDPLTWQALKNWMSTQRPVSAIARETGVSAWTLYAARSRLLARLRRELHDLLDG